MLWHRAQAGWGGGARALREQCKGSTPAPPQRTGGLASLAQPQGMPRPRCSRPCPQGRAALRWAGQQGNGMRAMASALRGPAARAKRNLRGPCQQPRCRAP